MVKRLISLTLGGFLVLPVPAFALYHLDGTPGRSEYAPGRAEAVGPVTPAPSPADYQSSPTAERPRGLLRRVEHAERLQRVLGFVRGMTQKLANLSARLSQHLANIERRIEALRAAGHTVTVDDELAAARTIVAQAQDDIAALVKELESLADSERPRAVVRTFRQSIEEVRARVRAVHRAFQTLRLAIRADIIVRATPSVSPVPTPAVTSPPPSPSPVLSPLP